MKECLITLLDAAFLECDANYGMPNAPQVAEYLLSNGVIVPPCKIGETLYRVWGAKGSKIKHHVRPFKLLWTNLRVTIEDFGKTVFLTEEEAERAANGQEKAD